ncbi:hypothetical protein [Paraburkholderia sp. CI2]|uniref:hypothetical protein n=1 Tax=Paraburkholderia sp. CI2 TaxID=2723093 RepID=UPI001C85C464|nr:hypothetical protein [Paraburkholderia sp. CI2]
MQARELVFDFRARRLELLLLCVAFRGVALQIFDHLIAICYLLSRVVARLFRIAFGLLGYLHVGLQAAHVMDAAEQSEHGRQNDPDL